VLQLATGGWESKLYLLAISLAVAVLVRGAGSFSVDGLLSKRMAQGQEADVFADKVDVIVYSCA
jgi:hypothetical protein